MEDLRCSRITTQVTRNLINIVGYYDLSFIIRHFIDFELTVSLSVTATDGATGRGQE